MMNQYRYSLWPQAPLPLPRVKAGTVADLGGGWLAIGDPRSPTPDEFTFTTPPPEMHLREMRDADLRDVDQLAELASVTGEPVDMTQPWRGLVSTRTFPEIAEAQYTQAVANIAEQLGLSPPASWDERRGDTFHVTEVAFVASLTRLLVDHLDAVLAERSPAPVWQRAGFLEPDEFHDKLAEITGVPALSDEPADDVAWFHFTEILNDGLAPFSAHVVQPELASQPNIRDITTSYSAACLLIFNDLTDGLPYRRCADETCGRMFRRQLGRSGGQYHRSSGVEFCTPLHARNQAQRERRRRDRAQRQKESD